MIKETDVYFDDVEIRDMNVYLLEGHEHPLLAATRDRTETLPGVNGSYDYGADLEPIPFNIPLGIREKNRIKVQQIARKFKSHIQDQFGKPKTIKLKFGYEPDKYYNVRYSGSMGIERLVTQGRFILPLVCYEGYAQSVVKNNEVTWGSKVLTFTAPYTFGHRGDGAKKFTSPGTTVFSIAGDSLKPILHVTGSGTNVTIKWNGKTINLGTFSNSNWVVNLNEYEVTKDGKNALNLIKGDWIDIYLGQGDNIIEVNGSGLDLTLRAEYRDRYS